MHPTMTFWDFPWPSARAYAGFVAIIFTIHFVKSLASAIQRSTLAANAGTASLPVIGSVAMGYLGSTIVFWVAALGFIAAYKG